MSHSNMHGATTSALDKAGGLGDGIKTIETLEYYLGLMCTGTCYEFLTGVIMAGRDHWDLMLLARQIG